MHNMGCLGHTLQIDLPRDGLGEPSPVTGCVEGGGVAGAELRAVFYFISSFPFLFAFDAGGLPA